MKFRITPLNIVGAIAAAFGLYYFLTLESTYPNMNPKGFLIWILAALVVVTFITDLIFRFTLKSLKRIWIVESTFIIITVILMVILQKVT